MSDPAIDTLRADRALVVVRASRLEDPVALCRALAAGGIRTVELTYTTPGLTDLLARVSAETREEEIVVGAGTVLTAEQACAALAAGARFLVTPGLPPEAVEIVAAGHAAGAAVILGALTPTEVLTAHTLGADAVKIFPARALGPRHLSDLRGPYPEVDLIPSGGVDEDNAAEFLRAGALAVTAGTSVVQPADVDEARWEQITTNAAHFRAALR
ncbi:2-dehydro-3-deoxyphosphogluconate aldolase/(4S)-4-hydroxy-2-oxoglutarate aldolase [Nocardioides luteus]|uniref:2-dehydro-3-deoxy-phosphogluconate aldolase n=1 Tax=Nocardioides luteus TaxID=1844 RepID=A0ABQ5SYN0_9ACTN|nr:bifunctional 4-hydroxy-2-oxoglutarate aldolase/2-dehydro-3-deoxy-phosphogluconate aldolase [Nocardioides luteus]MDR7310928.1 2-dehydro-3-deoxyphosphogluconate aldolase/(4S)-4-hydroxy-2-oxoglutarate aldolase [Nocardioides luteus]GGR39698.1 2-dehydro-3-deoxy-phosphogluconate aldolase [Nocardioides luteus]GLJ69292.1 2-dehydro-3-deoxy-phosphogluconate aldolase [Nocardioides luteus]